MGMPAASTEMSPSHEASAATTYAGGAVTSGAVVSTSVKYCSAVVLLPQSSVAVQILMMVHEQPPDMHVDVTE